MTSQRQATGTTHDMVEPEEGKNQRSIARVANQPQEGNLLGSGRDHRPIVWWERKLHTATGAVTLGSCSISQVVANQLGSYGGELACHRGRDNSNEAEKSHDQL